MKKFFIFPIKLISLVVLAILYMLAPVVSVCIWIFKRLAVFAGIIASGFGIYTAIKFGASPNVIILIAGAITLVIVSFYVHYLSAALQYLKNKLEIFIFGRPKTFVHLNPSIYQTHKMYEVF